MSKYEMTFHGSTDNITLFLSALLETKSTPFNTKYRLTGIENLQWSVKEDDTSEVTAIFEFDGDKIEEDGLSGIHEEYRVVTMYGKVRNETVDAG